jgi:copper chaperone CopZ
MTIISGIAGEHISDDVYVMLSRKWLPACMRNISAPVGQVEGFLDAVAVVDVDVDVQHPRVVFEQLQDGQHQVVDVAKPRRLCASQADSFCNPV